MMDDTINEQVATERSTKEHAELNWQIEKSRTAALRRRNKKLRQALEAARAMIFEHHEIGKMSKLQLGGCCPVCSGAAGNSTLNQIAKALQEAK